MIQRSLELRDRIIGVLLREARRQHGRTRAECADALGVPTSMIDAYEEGRASISLPELEVLGYVLDTPVAHFTQPEAQLTTEVERPDFQAMLGLRHRTIGILVRRARMELGMKQRDLAELLDCSTGRIVEFEQGEQPIPVAELELLARHLDLSLEHFLNGNTGVVGRWQRREDVDRRFHALPPAVQEFVARPMNLKYLELAMKLSQMPASELRGIAEALLEITC